MEIGDDGMNHQVPNTYSRTETWLSYVALAIAGLIMAWLIVGNLLAMHPTHVDTTTHTSRPACDTYDPWGGGGYPVGCEP